MRHQTEADATRVAEGVLLTVADIIGEHATLEDDSRQVQDIGGELHSMSRHLPGGAFHQLGGRPAPLRNGNVICQLKNEKPKKQPNPWGEVQKDENVSGSQSSSSARSHRRRRLLAEHRKHVLGGDKSREPDEEEDRNSLMTTPTATRTTEGEKLDADCEHASSSSDSASDEMDGGRILPAPALTGETDPIHLVNRRSEVTRALLSYFQWLRTRQLEWHNMQTTLVEELQIAVTCAVMRVTMLAQAFNVARGNYLPEGAVREEEYHALLPSEATMRAHRLVGEIIEACDFLSRRSTAGGGEVNERRQRARRTLQRMESSPVRQVRARNSDGGGLQVDRVGSGESDLEGEDHKDADEKKKPTITGRRMRT